jgi:hypothetical protein
MYQEWLDATSGLNNRYRRPRRLNQPVSLLVQVDEAIKECEQNPTLKTVGRVRKRVDAWVDSQDMVLIKRMTDWERIQEAISAVVKWYQSKVQDQEALAYSKAVVGLESAARIILNKFPMIPDWLQSALTRTFIKPGSNAPAHCFKCYGDKFEWKERLQTLGQPDADFKNLADGLCVEWTSDNTACSTKHEIWIAPYSRAIEIPASVILTTSGIDPSKGTLLHEMLHWITHPDYKDHVEREYGNNDWQGPYKFLKEGITEWLKRYAVDDWETGGYQDIFPFAESILKDDVHLVKRMMNAYFAGQDVDQVTRKLSSEFVGEPGARPGLSSFGT